VTRFQEYKIALRRAIGSNDMDQFEILLKRMRDDCVDYVQAVEQRTLPTFEFTFCYDRSDYEASISTYGGVAGESRGFVIGTVRGRNLIFVDVAAHLQLLQSANPDLKFIINLSLVILEELLHVLYPQLSEDDVNAKTMQLAQEFLGIQIP
jgi:hypothetical protein